MFFRLVHRPSPNRSKITVGAVGTVELAEFKCTLLILKTESKLLSPILKNKLNSNPIRAFKMLRPEKSMATSFPAKLPVPANELSKRKSNKEEALVASVISSITA